ncbi:glycine--tRNA ligase subunit beta [Elongatibacter sediminis]|uniref:Glycine--tRNA ligase beta subunit n=1 Tax=Elongatibacter sediminis TaxID=3119006 RepID=A0AAW9RMF9_9GAMM
MPESTSATASADLLIEIGCEELPPGALDALKDALFSGVCEGLANERITFDRPSSHAYASPRRLAVLLGSVSAAQPDQDLEKRGPAVTAAFDDDGRPTAAAEGFARSAGVAVSDLERLETDKGAWLVARTHQAGKPLAEVLYPVLEQALRRLPVPRPMRWGDHDFSFVRPVHWLVVLHGSSVVPGQLLGQVAGARTRGHRIHAPGPHPVPEAGAYLDTLRDARVLADPDERRERIRDQLLAADPATRIEPALLDEVCNLVEWPVAIACTFDADFLAVPHAALVASMQDHQKFFPVADAENPDAVTHRFVAIANLESTEPAEVRAGFERVIRPRLADARFFLEQDSKHPLDALAPALDKVVFQKKIGTIGDKSRRISEISKILAGKLDVDAAAAERGARLAKCDLMSQMVGEFPELQGIMGRHYALLAGEPQAVADAIADHYLPRFAGDRIPSSATGRVVALADRADTLVAIFAAGLRPTGNKDPFALRRSALGLVRILLEARMPLALDRLLALAANGISAQGVEVAPGLLADVRDFIIERARQHFRDAGHPAERIQAVLASNWTTLGDLEARLEALARFMDEDAAQSLAAANKRISNILKKSDSEDNGKIDEDILMLAEEKELYEQIVLAEQAVDPLLEGRDYGAALGQLALLRPVVDHFFDAVMVMDEDPALRRNRLALLARLKGQFDRIADLSVLG